MRMGKREMVWKWKSIGGVVKISMTLVVELLIMGIQKRDDFWIKVTRYKKIKINEMEECKGDKKG